MYQDRKLLITKYVTAEYLYIPYSGKDHSSSVLCLSNLWGQNLLQKMLIRPYLFCIFLKISNSKTDYFEQAGDEIGIYEKLIRLRKATLGVWVVWRSLIWQHVY